MKNFKIEKDTELENLLARSKKKGDSYFYLNGRLLPIILPYKKLEKVTELLGWYNPLTSIRDLRQIIQKHKKDIFQ